jgi:hypothetical protein
LPMRKSGRAKCALNIPTVRQSVAQAPPA